MSGGALFLLGLVVALIGVVIGDLVSKEVRTRLDMLPMALIRLAARRAPIQFRDELLAEWSAELYEILRGMDALPITRLWVGIRFSLGILCSAAAIGRVLQSGSPVVGSERARHRRHAVTRRIVHKVWRWRASQHARPAAFSMVAAAVVGGAAALRTDLASPWIWVNLALFSAGVCFVTTYLWQFEKQLAQLEHDYRNDTAG